MVNFDCRLGTRQLIVGANGAGKSTLFDVLSLLRDFCARGLILDDDFASRSRTRWQNVPQQSFELHVSGNGGEYKLRLVLDSWGRPERPRVVKEEVTFSGRPIFRFEMGEVYLYNDRGEGSPKVNYPFDWHRSALATIAERHDNTQLTWFKRWLDRLLIVSPDPRRMSGIASQEVKHPDQALANFADWYRHLRQETEDHAFIRDLGNVIEGFGGMRLEVAGERKREIKVRMSGPSDDKRDPPEYSLSELSDGQRVLVGLYAVLHFALRSGATICFDEPDNFIALKEVQPWLSSVLERTEDGESTCQVLIASHHPELLNRMAFKDGLLLDRPNGRHVRAAPFDDPSQTGLSPSELVARGWERA